MKIRNRDRNFGQDTMVVLVDNHSMIMSEQDVNAMIAHNAISKRFDKQGYQKRTSRVRGTIWFKMLPDGSVNIFTDGSKKLHNCKVREDKFGKFFVFRKERVNITRRTW